MSKAECWLPVYFFFVAERIKTIIRILEASVLVMGRVSLWCIKREISKIPWLGLFYVWVGRGAVINAVKIGGNQLFWLPPTLGTAQPLLRPDDKVK